MKKLIILLVIILSSLVSNASHCTGGNLTYRYIGPGDTYEITLNFYRDCSGILAPSNPTISISSSCYAAKTVTLAQVGGAQEVSVYCDGAITTCHHGTYPGIEKYVYTGTIDLGACSDWKLSYNICCRNAGITDLSAPSTTPMYIYSTLDNTTGDWDSPVFSNDPVPFICVGEYFCFDSKATSSFDSLRYQMVCPQQSNGTSVNYSGGFNCLSPISSIPAITFNSNTGLVCMTPHNQEIDVFAIIVQGYKDGSLVSQVERDIQVTITACSCTPLPINLISFNGEHILSGNLIKWTTASEINNDYFELQKGNVPDDIKTIAKVNGAGNSTMLINYSFLDTDPYGGCTYYKLNQVDFDGHNSYSNVICVDNIITDETQEVIMYNGLGQVVTDIQEHGITILYQKNKNGTYNVTKIMKM